MLATPPEDDHGTAPHSPERGCSAQDDGASVDWSPLEQCVIEYARSLWIQTAPSLASCDHAGELLKLGKRAYYRRWQTRWCVLKARALFYFKSHKDVNEPLGLLFLDTDADIEPTVMPPNAFMPAQRFVINVTVNLSCALESRRTFERRCYSFAAANQDEMDLWVAALTRARHLPPVTRTPSIYSAPAITPPVDSDRSSDIQSQHQISSTPSILNDSNENLDDRPNEELDTLEASCDTENIANRNLVVSEPSCGFQTCSDAGTDPQAESKSLDDCEATIPLGDKRLSISNHRLSQTSSNADSRISSIYSDSASMVTQIPLPLHLSILRLHLSRNFPNFRVLVFVSFNEIAKYIEYTSDAMDMGDSRRAINFLDPATKLVRKIRELLYTSDALFLKNFRNEEVTATLTRYMTVVIDRIRRVGLEAKQVTEEESIGIIRTTAVQQIYEHLCFLTRETWLFVSLCVRLSSLDNALHDDELLSKEFDPQGALSRMIQCVLDVSVRLCYCINTQSKTNFTDICNYLRNLFACVLDGILKHKESCLKSIDRGRLAELREKSRWSLEDEELSLFCELEQALLALKDSGKAASGLWPPLHADMIMADRFFTLTNLLLRLMFSSFLLGCQNDWLKLESSFLSLNVQMPSPQVSAEIPTLDSGEQIEPKPVVTMPTPPMSIPCTPPPSAVLPATGCQPSSVCSEHPHLERHFNHRKTTTQRQPRPTHPLSIPQSQEDYLRENRASSFGNSFDPSHDRYSVNMAISKSSTEYVKIVMHATKHIRDVILQESYTEQSQEYFIDSVGESTERIVTAATQITEDIAALECHEAPEYMFSNLESARSYLARTVHDSASLIKAHPEEPHPTLFQKLDDVDEACRNVLLAVSNIVCVHADSTKRETRTPSENETDILLGRMSLNTKKSSSTLVDERSMVRRNLSHAVDTFSPADESVEDAQKFVEAILDKENETLKSDPDIVYRLSENQEPLVRGGTLEKLVERLTFYKYPSADFMAAFLLTYRSFTTPSELLELLMCRYRVSVPDELTKKQKQIYNARKIIPIKLRVLNVCKMWIKSNFEDFIADFELLDKLRCFTQEMKKDFHKGGSDFELLLEKKASEKRPSISSPAIIQRDSVILCNLDIQSTSNLFRLMEIDPMTLAQQITIIQWEMFSAIGPHECLNQSWNRKELQHRSPHIRQMIRFSNFLVQWIATEIVSLQHARTRASMIKHFISVAEKLHALNNFDGLKGVLFGLQASGISRLKKTWELVPGKFKTSMDELSKLMGEEKSCKNYRNLLHSIDPPCIPFLGVYLTDLTMIEAGNSDYLNNDTKIINFHKRFLVAQVIHELKRYQCTSYSFSREDELYTWILTRPSWDAEAVYTQSLIIEPRPNRLSQFCSNFDPNTAFQQFNQSSDSSPDTESTKNEENSTSPTFDALSRRPSAGALLRRLSTRQ